MLTHCEPARGTAILYIVQGLEGTLVCMDVTCMHSSDVRIDPTFKSFHHSMQREGANTACLEKSFAKPGRQPSDGGVLFIFETSDMHESIVAPYGFGHSAYGEYSVVYSVFWAKIGRF